MFLMTLCKNNGQINKCLVLNNETNLKFDLLKLC